MATGALDANGIWIYGEDDSETTFSGLLNKLASSTSDTVTRLEGFTGYTGTLPIANGGTGQTTIAGIQSALGFRILQVVQANTKTFVSTTSTSFVTTGLAASITPSSTSSKILAMVTATVEASGVGLVGTIYRGATNIGDATHGTGRVSSGTNANFTFASTVLDSPATTSATTYTFYMRATSGTVYFNPVGALSTITLIEVRG